MFHFYPFYSSNRTNQYWQEIQLACWNVTLFSQVYAFMNTIKAAQNNSLIDMTCLFMLVELDIFSIRYSNELSDTHVQGSFARNSTSYGAFDF